MEIKTTASLLAAVVAGLLPASAAAEPPASGGRASNAIYLELGGSSFFYSLNYDRRVGKALALRIGAMYYSDSFKEEGGSEQRFRYYHVPLTASALLFGGNHHLEMGGGVVAGYLSAKEPLLSTSPVSLLRTAPGGPGAAVNAIAGYRFQPRDGGFLFRAGFTPLLSFHGTFFPWFGVSLGATF